MLDTWIISVLKHTFKDTIYISPQIQKQHFGNIIPADFSYWFCSLCVADVWCFWKIVSVLFNACQLGLFGSGKQELSWIIIFHVCVYCCSALVSKQWNSEKINNEIGRGRLASLWWYTVPCHIAPGPVFAKGKKWHRIFTSPLLYCPSSPSSMTGWIGSKCSNWEVLELYLYMANFTREIYPRLPLSTCSYKPRIKFPSEHMITRVTGKTTFLPRILECFLFAAIA